MRTYTIELYHNPAYGYVLARVHQGDFESNRDCLSPQMVRATEIQARSLKFAAVHASAYKASYFDEIEKRTA